MPSRLLPSRPRRSAVLPVCAGLAVTACGPGKAGAAVLNDGEAAQYVSAKFGGALESVYNEFAKDRSRKAKLTTHARINKAASDDATTTLTIPATGATLEQRRWQGRPDKELVLYHPGGSRVAYRRLGPKFASPAPTPWVSKPWEDFGPSQCSHTENLTPCRMFHTTEKSIKNDHPPMKEKSSNDGNVVVTTEVSLKTFLASTTLGDATKVIRNLPDEALKTPFPASIELSPVKDLRKITIDGTYVGATKNSKPFELEVRMSYEILGAPESSDFPQIPDATQVTHLPDDAAANDFNKRRGDLGG